MAKGVLVDLTKCIGCGSCTVACKMYNKNEWIDNRAPASGEEAMLADENWTVIQKCRINNETGKRITAIDEKCDSPETGGNETWRFVKRQCLHCQEPACASSCFATAFRKKESGETVYYPNLCVGCRYCMLACPFSIPKFEWSKPLPALRKCMMCSDRIANGDAPACVAVCPTNVMKFGERDELLKEAKEIIYNNKQYERHIYGEEEAGGTAWIYISDKPFEELGFKMDVPKRALSHYTKPYMHSTPIVGFVWLAVLTCLYFLTGFVSRRSAVKENTAKKQ
jgi:formate dehydrogenase iron-sulfur subunit